MEVIGKGSQADILLYKGKALKMMHDKPIEDARKEAKNQQYAYDVGLPVPAIHRIYSMGANACILMEYIKGESFVQAQRKDSEHTKEYLQEMVHLQMEVHQYIGGDLIDMKSRFRDEIQKTELSKHIKRKYLKELKHRRYEKCLCHFDFHPMNLIKTEQGKTYIIDWSNACAGSRLADVCNTYLIFYIVGQVELADSYLKLYCQQGGVSEEEVLNWVGLVACVKLSESLPKESKEVLLEMVRKDLQSKSILRLFRKCKE